MAGCYDIAARQEIFSGNKNETEEDQRAAAEPELAMTSVPNIFLWQNPGQMTVRFIPLLWQEKKV